MKKKVGTQIVNGKLLRQLCDERGWKNADLLSEIDKRGDSLSERKLDQMMAGGPARVATIKLVADALHVDMQILCVQDDQELPFYNSECFLLVDLRLWASPNNLVVLYSRNTYHNIPARTKQLKFEYATQGIGLRGASLNRPDHQFIDPSTLYQPSDETHLGKQGIILIEPKDEEKKGPYTVENRIEYIGAFQGEKEEWFHDHVNEPVNSETMILLFPPEKPCRKAWGVWKAGYVTPKVEHEKKPIMSPDGQVVCWNLLDLKPTETYELRWNW